MLLVGCYLECDCIVSNIIIMVSRLNYFKLSLFVESVSMKGQAAFLLISWAFANLISQSLQSNGNVVHNIENIMYV